MTKLAMKFASVMVLALSLTAIGSATCTFEGDHVKGGSVGVGTKATWTMSSIPSGCNLVFTSIDAKMVQYGNPTGSLSSAILELYTDSTCSTVSTDLSILAVSTPYASKDEWQFPLGGATSYGGNVMVVGGTSVCIAFTAGITNVIESITAVGYYTASN